MVAGIEHLAYQLLERGASLSKIIEHVVKTGARYTLTVNGKPKVTLIGTEELESILESLSILGDKQVMDRLKSSQKDWVEGDNLSLDELLLDGAAF